MHCRVRNLIFITVFLVIIFCTISCKALTYVGVDFPEWTGVGKERSYLEGREYEGFPDLSLTDIESGDFQSDFEQYMADAMPMHDGIMLLNAGIQRSSIAIAAAPFGYETYPTFYGSNYAYDSRNDSVVETSVSGTDKLASDCENAAESYAAFAESYPELDFVFYRVDRVSSSSNNPTSELVSNAVDTEYLTEHFFSHLGDKIAVVDGLATSQEEVFEWYYRSDHHWETPTAYQAYADILAVLKPGEPTVGYEEIVWDDVPFFGSLSRSGLCPVSDSDFIRDYWIDLAGLEVVVDGEPISVNLLDHRSKYESGEMAEDPYTNRYAEYFHGDYGLIEIHNEVASSDDALLIVGDSFTNPMERFFASSYRDIYVFDARHNDEPLHEFIAEHDIDDVAFVLGSTNFATENSLAAIEG